MNARSILLLSSLLTLLPFRAQCQSTLIRDVETYYQYDSYGNVTELDFDTSAGFGEQTITFAYNSPKWLVAMPLTNYQSSAMPAGQTVARTTAFVTDQNTGAISQETREPNGDETTFRLTTYTRDAHGIVTGLVEQDKSQQHQRSLSLQFDTEDLYPTAVSNGLNQYQNLAYHPAFGVLGAYNDPNGVLWKWQYDGFGRLKTQIAPDGGNFTLTYGGWPFDVSVQYANGQQGDILYDSYLNEVQRDSTAFDGQTVITLTSYSLNGQHPVIEKDGPCFYGPAPCGSAGSEQYTFDELGRLIGLRHADGSRRSWKYVGLKTSESDEVGNSRYIVQDALQQVIKSTAITDNGREISSTFGYEPFGLLHAITDPAGNVVTLNHDVEGRLTARNDPDSGSHTFQWNAFTELDNEKDGNGILTTYTRDILGRVTAVTNTDGTETFKWDSATNGIGSLARSLSTDGVATKYRYDPDGRLAWSTWTLNGNHYSLGFGYDSVGRLNIITYPHVAGQTDFQIERQYNQHGFLRQVVNTNTGSAIWEIDKLNERDQIVAEGFANGLSTQKVFDSRSRLKSITTTGGGSTQQNIAYEYYPNNSLHSRTNTFSSGSLVEAFNFDPLDRLMKWSAQFNGTGSLLDQTLEYDDLGNLRNRTTNPNNSSWPNLVYQYGQNGTGPHAVTQINSDSFGYDTGGEQTSGPSGRTIHYKAFGLPDKVAEGSATTLFQYDANDRRAFKQFSSTDSTVYAGGLFEKRSHQGQTTDVFYVPGDSGRLIAQVQLDETSGNYNTFFLHDDRLGSIQTVTGNTAGNGEQLNYEPLGRPTDPGNPQTIVMPPLTNVSLGFTGQSGDADLNLINMRGRIYDPKIGRFLTPDPLVQDPFRSESLNRYSYAWNNPLKWFDPSGFQNQSSGGLKNAYTTVGDDCGANPHCEQITFSEPEVIQATGLPFATEDWLTDTDNPLFNTSADSLRYMDDPNKFMENLYKTGLVARPVYDPTGEVMGRAFTHLLGQYSNFGVAKLGVQSAVYLQNMNNASRLVHLTTSRGAAGINATGQLMSTRGLFAGPLSNASVSGVQVTLRTGLTTAEAAVPIPPIAAAGNFSSPVVIGPMTAWQRIMGTVYGPAGAIDLETGILTSSGVNSRQMLFYGVDAMSTGVAGTALYMNSYINQDDTTQTPTPSLSDDGLYLQYPEPAPDAGSPE